MFLSHFCLSSVPLFLFYLIIVCYIYFAAGNGAWLYVCLFSRISQQEGQHPLTGQRAANFRLLANQ